MIEPMSVSFVEVVTKIKGTGSCVISPLDNSPVLVDQPGLVMPNIISNGSHKVWVPLVNTTSTRFSLKQKQALGIAEKLAENEIYEINKESENVSACFKTGSDCDNKVLQDIEIGHIDCRHKKKLHELMEKYRHIFAQSDNELGRTSLVEMKLNTGDHPPVKRRPYQTPFSQRPLLEKHLEGLLEAGIIRPSVSPWASPIVVVPKKDGSLRMAIDYRMTANKALIANSYPLPNIDEVLSSMQGSSVFSCLDLKSGYYQIAVAEEDKAKTAFVCHKGLFEFNVMPFGLSSAPPIFQELMDKVLGPVKNVHAIAYLDDIVLYSKSPEEHLEHLQDIFSRLEKAGLKLKPSKCSFFRKKVKYLGHVISEEGVAPDPEKVSVIKRLQAPKTVREVRSVVGMASYYRKFINNFSQIIRPLTELTKKHVRFEWNEERQKAFEKIKQSLSEAEVLAHPDFKRPFKLYTDASLYAVGAVLTQDFDDGEHVIQYLSKQLTTGQQKWPTIEREAYAIIHAVNKLRHFLLGHKFVIYTDHKPLRSLFTSEMKNARVQRWAIILDEYGCQIEYKSGKSNVPADMLSRVPIDVQNISVIDNSKLAEGYDSQSDSDSFEELDKTLDTALADQIAQLQRDDSNLNQIIQGLDENPEDKKVQNFVLEENRLYHVSVPVKHDRTQTLQLVVPKSLTESVLQEAHNSQFGGCHASHDKMYDKLRLRYYWERMYQDAVEFVANCGLCRSKKLKKVRRPLQEMPIPQYPFEMVGIDTCGPFPESLQGNKYIVTIVDHFSSWPEAYAVPDKTAETVARLLLEKFFPVHACPQTILSDRGTEFVNGVIEYLLTKMKVLHIKTSPFHPQTNGKTERFHRYMNDVLAKYIQKEPCNWDSYIPGMLMAYRTSVNESTLHTPFFLVYGRDPVLPMDTLLRPKLKYMGDEYVPCMLQRLHLAYMEARNNMAEARARNKRIYDKKAETADFKPGDTVYYLDKTVPQGRSAKLHLAWTPHYCVLEQKSPVTFVIKNQLNGKTKLVHAENLQLALPEHIWDIPRTDYERLESGKQESQPERRQPPRVSKLLFDPNLGNGSQMTTCHDTLVPNSPLGYPKRGETQYQSSQSTSIPRKRRRLDTSEEEVDTDVEMEEQTRARKRKESVLPLDEVGKTKKMRYVHVTEAIEPLVMKVCEKLSTPAVLMLRWIGLLQDE